MEKYSIRVKEKIENLHIWIEQLQQILPPSLTEYSQNFVVNAACERIVEKIIEENIIMTHLILKEKGIIKREKCFDSLFDLGIIPKKLALKLENSKGMRNLMIHQYDNFDEQIFYESIYQLIKDTRNFIDQIEINLN